MNDSKGSPKIVFMGTPDFAAYSLEYLIKRGYHISHVVTAPDKPAGRGKKIRTSAVKEKAAQYDLPVFQPENLKDPTFVKKITQISPDIIIVVAFRKLPKEIWSIPQSGTFNLHASFLPYYRGAAPINWAIINGEKQTGLTTFFIDDHIDTGQIIYREKHAIEKDDTAKTLHDRLMVHGANVIDKTIQLISLGAVKTADQEMLAKNEKLPTAPKITKEMCKIDWNNSTHYIYNKIRGLSPIPGAHTNFHYPSGQSEMIKIFFAQEEPFQHSNDIGSVVVKNSGELRIYCNDGYLKIIELQAAGRKRMHVSEFLLGKKLENGVFAR